MNSKRERMVEELMKELGSDFESGGGFRLRRVPVTGPKVCRTKHCRGMGTAGRLALGFPHPLSPVVMPELTYVGAICECVVSRWL